MRGPKNEFLAAVFGLAAIAGTRLYYGAMDSLGIPHRLYTTYFFPEDVKSLLLNGSHIEFSENAERFLEDVHRIRLHAEPALMPGKWRVGIEKTLLEPIAGETTALKWLNAWFTYEKAETLLSEFERTGFQGLVTRNMRGSPDMDEPTSAQIIYHIHYTNYRDLHPTHIVSALGFELPQLWQKPAAVFNAQAEPKTFPKIVDLLEKRREIGKKGTGKTARRPQKRR